MINNKDKSKKPADLGLIAIIAGELAHDSNVLIPSNIDGRQLRTGETYTIGNGEFNVRIMHRASKGMYAHVTRKNDY